ncbi:hypothetical protein NGB36_00925 [Streptomyces sp. RB6PN25]|uniref:Uncharacterized protein n=1 Tax=Streptomyces humicola TaxID=2953240 RepID=A0ABT1PNI3_9ACTN|nr:hypothetical protein [Streptomyces humicola]MCQ4079214.1 hypothetical protein [Streptomyces humicola]
MLVGIVSQMALALGLMLVGRWGRRRAAALVPASLSGTDRDRRIVAMRRGALACKALGVLFAFASIPAIGWR